MKFYKIDTSTRLLDLNYISRLDRKTADTLNYAYALNGSSVRLISAQEARRSSGWRISYVPGKR